MTDDDKEDLSIPEDDFDIDDNDFSLPTDDGEAAGSIDDLASQGPIDDDFLDHEDHFEDSPTPQAPDVNYEESSDHDLIIEEDEEIETEPLDEQEGSPEIDGNGTTIATTPTKSLLILVIGVLFSAYFLYTMLFSESDEESRKSELADIAKSQSLDTAEKQTPNIISNQTPEFVDATEDPELLDPGSLPTPEIDVVLPPLLPEPSITPPQLEEEEERVAVVAPPTITDDITRPENRAVVPPSAIVPQTPTQSEPKPQVIIETGPSAAELLAAKRSRRRAQMLVMNGGGTPSGNSKQVGGADGTLTYEELENSNFESSVAMKVPNTDYLIAAGKMIHAVLETAINTDLEGPLRALVSRDIYAESGRNILIPKGSRLLGEYQSGVARGQKRVLITWKRVLLPNGIDIELESPGTDQLGRAGVRGIVDNKFFEIFKNSFLLSALTIGGAIAIDKVETSQGLNTTSSTNSSGDSSTSQTGTPTDFAVLDAVRDLNEVADQIAEQLLDADPTITVDQGTVINIFVMRDLIFPQNGVKGDLLVIN